MVRIAVPITLAAVLVAAGACASSQSASDPGTLVLPPTGSGRRAITNEYPAITTSVPISADSAYQALKRVYDVLEIPVSQESGKDHSVGNADLRVRRKLAGLNMKDVVDCGQKLDIPNAETWDISMAIFSTAVATTNGASTIYTQIQATGHDPSQGNGHWIPCSTMSALEEKIGATLKSEIAK